MSTLFEISNPSYLLFPALLGTVDSRTGVPADWVLSYSS